MDVKVAFLNGDLDEEETTYSVYLEGKQALGFQAKKSIYGLK